MLNGMCGLDVRVVFWI